MYFRILYGVFIHIFLEFDRITYGLKYHKIRITYKVVLLKKLIQYCEESPHLYEAHRIRLSMYLHCICLDFFVYITYFVYLEALTSSVCICVCYKHVLKPQMEESSINSKDSQQYFSFTSFNFLLQMKIFKSQEFFSTNNFPCVHTCIQKPDQICQQCSHNESETTCYTTITYRYMFTDTCFSIIINNMNKMFYQLSSKII